jgi:hypothetical protein
MPEVIELNETGTAERASGGAGGISHRTSIQGPPEGYRLILD